MFISIFFKTMKAQCQIQALLLIVLVLCGTGVNVFLPATATANSVLSPSDPSYYSSGQHKKGKGEPEWLYNDRVQSINSYYFLDHEEYDLAYELAHGFLESPFLPQSKPGRCQLEDGNFEKYPWYLYSNKGGRCTNCERVCRAITRQIDYLRYNQKRWGSFSAKIDGRRGEKIERKNELCLRKCQDYLAMEVLPERRRNWDKLRGIDYGSDVLTYYQYKQIKNKEHKSYSKCVFEKLSLLDPRLEEELYEEVETFSPYQVLNDMEVRDRIYPIAAKACLVENPHLAIQRPYLAYGLEKFVPNDKEQWGETDSYPNSIPVINDREVKTNDQPYSQAQGDEKGTDSGRQYNGVDEVSGSSSINSIAGDHFRFEQCKQRVKANIAKSNGGLNSDFDAKDIGEPINEGDRLNETVEMVCRDWVDENYEGVKFTCRDLKKFKFKGKFIATKETRKLKVYVEDFSNFEVRNGWDCFDGKINFYTTASTTDEREKDLLDLKSSLRDNSYNRYQEFYRYLEERVFDSESKDGLLASIPMRGICEPWGMIQMHFDFVGAPAYLRMDHCADRNGNLFRCGYAGNGESPQLLFIEERVR